MTALISVYNSDGCVGRCDSKCYDAQSDECDCICGGKNHGAGLERARANVAEYAEHELERWAEQQGLDPRELKLNAQGDLFPYGAEPSTAEIRRNLRRAKRGAVAAAVALLAGCGMPPSAPPLPKVGDADYGAPEHCVDVGPPGVYALVCPLELEGGTRCAVLVDWRAAVAMSCDWGRP